jgi:hypothetical protein
MDRAIDAGAAAVKLGGHDGIYRRIDGLEAEWIADIEGRTATIRLTAEPGTSQTVLEEAHAIIDSIRVESKDDDPGFRLIFTLSTGNWDSG